jgi:hypothetical protein
MKSFYNAIILNCNSYYYVVQNVMTFAMAMSSSLKMKISRRRMSR